MNLIVYPGPQDEPFLSRFTWFVENRYRRQDPSYVFSLFSCLFSQRELKVGTDE